MLFHIIQDLCVRVCVALCGWRWQYAVIKLLIIILDLIGLKNFYNFLARNKNANLT